MPSGQQPCEGGDQPGISPFRNRRAGRPRRTGQILITPDGGRAAFQRPRGRRKKQVTPGVQRPGPRPQNGGDGMGNINPEGKTPQGRGSGRHAQRRYRDRLGKPRTDGGVPQEVLELQHGKPQPRKTGAEPGTVSRETPASPAPCDGGETTEPGPVCAHRNGAAPPPGAASSVPRDHES